MLYIGVYHSEVIPTIMYMSIEIHWLKGSVIDQITTLVMNSILAKIIPSLCLYIMKRLVSDEKEPEKLKSDI